MSEKKQGTLVNWRHPCPVCAVAPDIKATFSDGVLEVSVPVPPRPEANVRRVQIEEPKTAAKSAA